MDYRKWQKYEGNASTFAQQAAKAEVDVGAALAAYREMPGVKVIHDTVMYNIDMNVPLPPVTRRVGKAPELGMPYGQRRERVKPKLRVRAFEGLPGLWLCEARSDEEGPRVNTADLGFPPFTTKDGALAFSGFVCAEWWRRHA